MSLAKVERLVRDRAGLDPASLGTTAFAAAVTGRMNALGIDSHAKYAEQLQADSAEWDRLLDSLVVPESWFFRGGRALFDFLAKSLMTIADREGRPARVLCIPCGFGEEPYSLAIALQELGAAAKSVVIEGADLSPAHLARAAEGRFSSFSFRETDPALRDRYFRPGRGEEWQLIPAVRSRVHFARCNLSITNAEDAGSFDVVVCRNVFIYLTDEARRQAVANLEHWLAPTGFLCVSPAEADRLPREKFSRMESEGSLLYRRRVPTSTESKRVPAVRSPRSVASKAPALRSEDSASRLRRKPETPIPAPDPLIGIRELADRGDLTAALAACQKLVAGRSPSPDAFGLLGVLHVAGGNATGAVEAFTKALYLQPDHAESLEHLALISEQRGDRTRAAALRRKLKRAGGDA